MYLLQKPRYSVLHDYIDNYWCLTLDQNRHEFNEHIFADGKADIIFNFGVSYQRQTSEQIAGSQIVRVTHLDAQRAYPLTISQVGSIHLIGVRLQVGALHVFLDDIPLHELTGEIVSLDHIFGNEGNVLESRLFDLKRDFNAQVNVLDRFFLSRLKPKTQLTLVNELGAKLVSLPIHQISKEMGYSERTLHRMFRKQTGFSPTLYARMLRFQWSLSLLHDVSSTLSEIAYQCGYYDQAHFTKDFKEFSGITPSAFRASLQSNPR
ncbi:MAG: helix-turn-helix transcriptional regulator [Aggregatilineales bacterium]